MTQNWSIFRTARSENRDEPSQPSFQISSKSAEHLVKGDTLYGPSNSPLEAVCGAQVGPFYITKYKSDKSRQMITEKVTKTSARREQDDESRKNYGFTDG